MTSSSPSLRRWVYQELQLQSPATPAQQESAAPSKPESDAAPGATESEVSAIVASAVAESERLWALAAEEQKGQARVQLAAALEAFAAERLQHQRIVETEAVRLALTLARKILQREARVDPHLLLELVQKALDRAGTGVNVRLRVAPQDAIQWQKSVETSNSPLLYTIEVDPSLAAGACVVETDLGQADLGWEAQMNELELCMLPLLKTHPAQRLDLETSAASSESEPGPDDLNLAIEAA